MREFYNFLAGLIIGALLNGCYVTDKITGSPWTPRDAVFERVK